MILVQNFYINSFLSRQLRFFADSAIVLLGFGKPLPQEKLARIKVQSYSPGWFTER
ncbi:MULTISPECIES: hypothetical protein [Planktothricoides]|uniref:Uncharacterized protein n=2 Tax=Planktothricoides raciborskii TaxID=132608 RepID=A0AAU8J946_9CYAN|nr:MULTISPECIES: hypothetical protein [Planktothricoides]MBD2543957.1 hypothetical protein [Planktothricoides raciborskii FACHB-1370]MBD2582944.1 hypothetical protein [Planktothricoides raciborskii FACHB-1261]